MVRKSRKDAPRRDPYSDSMARSVLLEAWKLIRGGWTRNAYARTPGRFAVNYDHPRACKFCLSGAVYRAADKFNTKRNSGHAAGNVLTILKDQIEKTHGWPVSVTMWNDFDARNKYEVLALIQAAIIERGGKTIKVRKLPRR